MIVIENDYPELQFSTHLKTGDNLSISSSLYLITHEEGLSNIQDIFLVYSPAGDKGSIDSSSSMGYTGETYKFPIEEILEGTMDFETRVKMDFGFGNDVLSILLDRTIFSCEKNESSLIKNGNIGVCEAKIHKVFLNGVELSKNSKSCENPIDGYGGKLFVKNDYPELKFSIHFKADDILTSGQSVYLLTGEEGLTNDQEIILSYIPRVHKGHMDKLTNQPYKIESFRFRIQDLLKKEIGVRSRMDIKFGDNVLMIVLDKTISSCEEGKLPLIKNSNIGAIEVRVHEAFLNGTELSKSSEDVENIVENVLSRRIEGIIKDIL